ncbi:myb-like protein P isoform X3 [Lucilia sericata]|uniref:myb-like protein P isoform X3 n=2 Tax=Lucilia sericata TaxID=13632 RepID=UPI0018A7F30E|nr:myb-like protein P isoform X3 [Lucilia sericata]
MPTECERSSTSPATTTITNNSAELKDNLNEDSAAAAQQQQQQQHSAMMDNSDNMSTSQTSTTSNGSSSCNGGRKTSITSPDPTAYVAKARVTRPTPPPPPYNPMQFVQIKPCNLYQTAQEQLKKAEEVKKIKEIRKEEPEDWQNNLDNWKSSRRKRVEHIIDRVVEVKKLELEEHDRTRRKSKTFSEMIEERGERSGGRGLNKLASLAVYAEDEANDLSDLGIGTSSASGKSSLSEDYDNNSVMSDNAAELDKAITNSTHHNNKPNTTESTTREYISSPGYETSSSTAPASSPDPCEYTYEGAIQDYKQRVSRAASGLTSVNLNKLTSQQQHTNSKESTPERPLNKETAAYPPRRGSKIEDRLMGFEVQSPSEECVEKNKVDVPKIDISKRKEIFESIDQTPEPKSTHAGSNGGSAVPRVTLRDRFKVQETNSETLTEQPKKELKRLSGDITSIKERLQSLEQQQNLVNGANGATKTTANKLVDIPVPPLKERLSSLQNAVTKEEVRKPPVVLVDARQLEIMKCEEEKAQQTLKQETIKEEKETKTIATKTQEVEEIDRDDSGIHTADDVELELERHQADKMKKEQELKLNAAIEALAKEEQQLSEAANAVNQIEAEFEELTLGSLPPMASNTTASEASATTITNDHMEYSINEALELALAAIDKETIPQLQQQQQPTPQQQPENLYPITAPSNNTISTTTTTTTTNNNNNNNILKEIAQETEILEVVHKTLESKEKEEILINKTDEEKCEKLKLEEQFTTTLEIKEKSEEEISKEPIYENISSTTSTGEVDVVITTKKTSYQQQQQQQQQQIIPSMMSKTQIDIDLTTTTTTNNDSKQNFNSQNLKQNQNSNSNQTIKQNLASASNQLQNSQINNSFNCPNNNNNNNNNSKINNNIQNNQNINNNNCKVVELTNAFANTTITTTTSAKTTTTKNKNHSDLNTTTTFKEITFNHLEQPTIESSEVEIKTTALTVNDNLPKTLPTTTKETAINNPNPSGDLNTEPYYQVPKSSEPYYDAPKHLKPVPVYENIEIFFNGNNSSDLNPHDLSVNLQPPKEKPPPPPVDSPPLFDDVDSSSHTDAWSSDNTYETLSRHQLNHHNHQHHLSPDQPSPPIKRMNSTKRIKKELRNKRSSFLGIEGSSLDDDETYLELTVAPPPDMAQLLQEERRLEKQLYLKAGLCDSSDTGESRDSGVSENHSRQSSEHYTNSSEENETHDDTTSPLTLQTQTGLDVPPPADMLYQNDGLLAVVQTPLLTTVKGNSAESWTESATVAAAATQSLTEATATANAKMMSIEEKIREQEEVLRVERELLQLEQEELKRQRENLMLRENMARRELQHGAKMLMSANRRSLQDLNGLGGGMTVVNINGEAGNNMDMYHSQMNHNMQNSQHLLSQTQLAQPQQQQPQPPQQQSQQIYANIPNLQQQYYHMENDYRKSMSDINEFSKRMMSQPPPAPPSKPMRAMHINTNTTNGIMINGDHQDYAGRQRHSLNSQHFGGSLVKIAPAQPTAAPRAAPHIYSNYHHQSVQNLSSSTTAPQSAQVVNSNNSVNQSLYPGNMSRNTLHALSATPKPKYTDGWVQVQQRKSYDSNLANDPAWLSAYQQKRKSMPDSYHGYNQNNHWLIQEAEQRRLSEQQQQQRRTVNTTNTNTVHQSNNKLVNGSAMISSSTNGKPLPDSIIQTLTERVQSKGIGERKRNTLDKSPLHAASTYQQYQQQQYNNKLNQQQQQQQQSTVSNAVIHRHNNIITSTTSVSTTSTSSTTNLQGQSNLNTTTQQQQQQQQDKVLSVSGKKKCSHCGDELDMGCTADKCRHTHRELKYIVWV